MASAGTTRWGSSVASGDDQPWLIAAEATNEQKLLRGGSWIGDPGDCRSAYRSHNEPVIDDDDVGFRVVCLPRSLSLTPTQFVEVCAVNPESVLELDADGSLIEMTSSGGFSNARNSAVVFQRTPGGEPPLSDSAE